MFFQNIEMYNDVININFDEIFVRSKKTIYLFLNVNRRIFKTHYDYVERFLISMCDYCQFMFVSIMNFSLIKKTKQSTTIIY